MGRKADNWIQTRESLLSRLKNLEDRASWEDFFNTYWKLVYNVSLKSGLTASEAEEVVQETFITIAKKIGDFQYNASVGSFKGWLLRTTQWRIGDQFRKRKKHPSADRSGVMSPAGTIALEQVPDPNALDLESDWEELWRENLLEAAVERVKDQVNPTTFQMFDFVVNRDWPAKKVATKMNVSIARVYYARHKVAGLIRAEMKQLKQQERLDGRGSLLCGKS